MLVIYLNWNQFQGEINVCLRPIGLIHYSEFSSLLQIHFKKGLFQTATWLKREMGHAVVQKPVKNISPDKPVKKTTKCEDKPVKSE